jgi:hypothetical protein
MEAMDGMFKNYTADVEEERGQFVNNKGYMAVHIISWIEWINSPVFKTGDNVFICK